jgi:molybdate transport system substrate-binding protein
MELPDADIVASEQEVVDAIAKGEADAGIAYVTDALSRTEVDAVDLTASLQSEVVYPAAVLKGASNPTVARAFVDFLTGPSGSALLLGSGFGPTR